MATQKNNIPLKSTGDEHFAIELNEVAQVQNNNADEIDANAATTTRVLTSAGTVQDSDFNNVIEVNGTFTLTFPAGLIPNFATTIVNVGAGTVTLAPSGGATIVGKNLSINPETYSACTVYASGPDAYVALGDLVGI